MMTNRFTEMTDEEVATAIDELVDKRVAERLEPMNSIIDRTVENRIRGIGPDLPRMASLHRAAVDRLEKMMKDGAEPMALAAADLLLKYTTGDSKRGLR